MIRDQDSSSYNGHQGDTPIEYFLYFSVLLCHEVINYMLLLVVFLHICCNRNDVYISEIKYFTHDIVVVSNNVISDNGEYQYT